jgi:hypothetical protein
MEVVPLFVVLMFTEPWRETAEGGSEAWLTAPLKVNVIEALRKTPVGQTGGDVGEPEHVLPKRRRDALHADFRERVRRGRRPGGTTTAAATRKADGEYDSKHGREGRTPRSLVMFTSLQVPGRDRSRPIRG